MRENISFNKECLLKGGKPWFPMMGEMHYSRFNCRYWRESLEKMMAGGIEIVSSYVIWIHHEEIEGKYNFSFNMNLHEFVKIVKDVGLKMVLRIGPWIHGEVRNGGFPDWLYSKDFIPRTNNEKYFAVVKEFYTKIYEQVKEFFYKDNGPIIGIQIENEFGHCGGLNGDEGNYHMERLLNMAKEIGFDTPLYTATGWGGAMIGSMLPVMGAYPDAPWDEKIIKLDPNPNFLFSYERNDKSIGSDFKIGHGLTFDINKYPYLMAELGGGMQSTNHRRLLTSEKDIGAMSLSKLGSGANLLGYYMYHGGTNPIGVLSSFEENKASGSLNDMPVFNYDGRFPLRQYGSFSKTFYEIRLLALFLKDFGEELALMKTLIKEDNARHANDFESLRYSFRKDDKKGFLFINNYQRGYDLKDHMLDIKIDDVTFKNLEIKNGDYYFYPFNYPMGNTILKSCNASLLMKVNNDYVFYTDKNVYYDFISEPNFNVITLTKNEALKATKITFDQEYLVITSGCIVNNHLYHYGNNDLLVYPEPTKKPFGYTKKGKVGIFTKYVKKIIRKEAQVDFTLTKETNEALFYDIEISYFDVLDVILNFDYEGKKAELYIDDKIVNDDFYNGGGFQASLRYFNYPHKLKIKITKLTDYDLKNIYFEVVPKSRGKLISIDYEIEYVECSKEEL